MSKIEPSARDQAALRTSGDEPEISIIMACYNAAEYLDEAVQSALAQASISLEVLVIDDHSSDQSMQLAQEWARRDPRVRVFQTAQNSGPGGARNVGIEHMRGRWYAMLDCDDAFEPERCRRLVDAAESWGADMIADDLRVFGDEIETCRHLGDTFRPQSDTISLEAYFAGTVMFSSEPNLGFLKPIIRRDALSSERYRTDLRIGEDDELVIRLLLGGAHYAYFPKPLYRYRKHDASISHRLSAKNSALMVQSEKDIRAKVQAAGKASNAYDARYASILDAAAFSRSIDALKAKRFAAALGAIIERPSALRHFAMPIAARWRRLTGNA
ncbi:glycosyltransferase family 2 protein [Erythrobacter sp. YT30]|uniref:glycosyltransferase family 2 protein n=1 Tax=Erythrobacter sp. YT30 TaxID=1735012 RepID=UPI00076D710D|nr:glycosyltransferase family 2 protein [Erythrobacter sp. YT30]KWV90962.1 hypothetical protein AUC45_06410 [Erythrobacter sp. YT30]